MSAPRRLLLGLWVGLVIGGALALMVRSGAPPLGRELLFWLIACAAGEVLWVRLPVGQATVSMASCFNFTALLVLSARASMPVTALATLIAELVVMRKTPVKALFNAGQTALAVFCARACFDACGGQGANLIDLVSTLQLLPFAVAAAAYYAVNRAAVVVVVAIAQGLSPLESWRRNFGSAYDPLSAGAALSLGALLATHYASIGMIGTLFVALPLVLACDGYRRFTRDAAPKPVESEPDRRAA